MLSDGPGTPGQVHGGVSVNDFWFHETNTPGYVVKWKVNHILHTEKTPFQELAIIDTPEWGRALVLDGALQVSEKDEFIYHEMIAHVALNSHPHPQRVLIIGGGDGGTLREVARHSQVQAIDMVEIDERVVKTCQEYLPTISCAFSDPRLNLYFADGIEYVRNTSSRYDIVIVDSSDPVGPAVELFSHSFYKNVFSILNPEGMVVVQAESPLFYQDAFTSTYRNLAAVFPLTLVYLATVPTYVSGPWAFTIASKKQDPRQLSSDRDKLSGLKYYNEAVHQAAFSLPTFIAGMLL